MHLTETKKKIVVAFYIKNFCDLDSIYSVTCIQLNAVVRFKLLCIFSSLLGYSLKSVEHGEQTECIYFKLFIIILCLCRIFFTFANKDINIIIICKTFYFPIKEQFYFYKFSPTINIYLYSCYVQYFIYKLQYCFSIQI